jgi:hypothetical protein
MVNGVTQNIIRKGGVSNPPKKIQDKLYFFTFFSLVFYQNKSRFEFRI